MILMLLVFAGCSAGNGGGPATPAASAAARIQPIFANSVLEVGPNRFAVGFLDPAAGLIDDARVSASFAPDGVAGSDTRLDVELVPIRVQEHATAHSGHGGTGPAETLVTVYVATVDFPAEGRWTVDLRLDRAGTPLDPIKATFEVFRDAPQPSVGERIPSTRQVVRRDVAELSAIDTSSVPDDSMHERTVAEALELGQPLVIGFATPAFCETRMCGPVVEEILRPVDEAYGERVEVIHIEPFDIARARSGQLVAVPAMAEWSLDTEPWIFVTDAEGRVVAKFEGPSTRAEVEGVLERLGVEKP